MTGVMLAAGKASAHAPGISTGVIAAIGLVAVVIWWWRARPSLLGVALAILFGVLIARTNGPIAHTADWIIDAFRTVFGWLTSLFH
ncbi:hypothetical protein ABZ671_01000 [Micromonospora sp. NPDC006766]|uniref:hypothetical protein n=1 Tax=Micromonospora sp. NPDC006766 TaxID=3154778 RepID=UPI0033EBA7A7